MEKCSKNAVLRDKNGTSVQRIDHEWSLQDSKLLWVGQGASGEGCEGLGRHYTLVWKHCILGRHYIYEKYFSFFNNELILAYCNLFTFIHFLIFETLQFFCNNTA